MKKINKNKRLYSIINISIILSLICIIALSVIVYYNNIYINQEMITRSKSYIRSIEITREWNASTGGVYVEKTSDTKSNPFIANPDIRTIDGKKYTLKNSSIMTMEMSQISGKDGLSSYTMRSLKPLNPANSPDNFEKEALNLFKTGVKVFHKKIISDKNVYFRYMSPLYATKDCITCHINQGYKSGDIIGGISITLDITSNEKNAAISKYSAIILGILSVFFIAGVLLISTSYLKMDLNKSEEKIEILNITDDMTSLYNRNYFFQKLKEEFERSRRYNHPLSLIIANIDSFKTYNETHGLHAGDMVIKNVANVIKPLCRLSDTVSRYGETEFAIILPNTDEKGALIMAEKLRSEVEEFKDKKSKEYVTISLGISTISPDLAYSAETLVNDADTALYKAKESGINRAVLYNPA